MSAGPTLQGDRPVRLRLQQHLDGGSAIGAERVAQHAMQQLLSAAAGVVQHQL